MKADVYTGATISACGAYRYRLWRIWEPELPRALFIMLNPSTADANLDDATIRKCRGFTRRFGCGGLEVVNLYGLRATDPRELRRCDDPVGPDNDRALRAMLGLGTVGLAVAAWGGHAQPNRAEAVRDMARSQGVALHHLGPLNFGGSPKHPLYLSGDTPLNEWSGAGAAA